MKDGIRKGIQMELGVRESRMGLQLEKGSCLGGRRVVSENWEWHRKIKNSMMVLNDGAGTGN